MVAASPDGLPPAFVDLIEVLDKVADMLARTRVEHIVVRDVIAQIPNRDGTLRNRTQAKRLVKQAKEYLTTGFQSRRNHSKSMYLRRLELLIEQTEKHVVGEIVENIIIADLDATGKPAGAKRMKTRVRKDIFNPAAAQILMKAYKEVAVLTGGRATDGAISLVQNNLNVGAHATSMLPTAELARSLANSVGLNLLDVAPSEPIPEATKLPDAEAPETDPE